MAESFAAPAPDLLDSFQRIGESIVAMSINRTETRAALAEGRGTGLRKLVARTFHGVRSLMEAADALNRTATGGPVGTMDRIKGAVKKQLVMAGAAIIVEAAVNLIPLGWLSLAGPLIRPVIKYYALKVVGLGVDVAVMFRKDDV
jgi:hypothetical protein